MCTFRHVQKETHIMKTYTIYSRHLTLGKVWPRICLATAVQGPKNGNDMQRCVVSCQLSLNHIENTVTTLSVGPSHMRSLTVTSWCVRLHTYKYNLTFHHHKHRQYQHQLLLHYKGILGHVSSTHTNGTQPTANGKAVPVHHEGV
jgi:hypothetical protein